MNDLKDTVCVYFKYGFQYKVILLFLSLYHGINISLRTLKRRLRDYGLERRNRAPNMSAVWNTIRNELQGPGIKSNIYIRYWKTHSYFIGIIALSRCNLYQYCICRCNISVYHCDFDMTGWLSSMPVLLNCEYQAVAYILFQA